jgi:hypothetical protein
MIGRYLSKRYNTLSMMGKPNRAFATMAPEVGNHLAALGITNPNVIYNPR